jgi:hypothetical protein
MLKLNLLGIDVIRDKDEYPLGTFEPQKYNK